MFPRGMRKFLPIRMACSDCDDKMCASGRKIIITGSLPEQGKKASVSQVRRSRYESLRQKDLLLQKNK